MRSFEASRLEIVRVLGEGARGAVMAVRDRDTGALLARKRLDDAAGARELLLLSRLRHPNIIALEGTAADGQERFLLMELAERGDLAAALRDGAPVAPLLADALRALAFLHSRGVVHADLKPQNLLVGADGRLRVADLGLARSAGSGEEGGTLAYMAPERLAGAPAGASSDLYSLGAAFAVALGAPLPADAARAPADLARALAAGPVAVRAGPLAALLRELLSPDPAKRPAGARAAARRLASCAADESFARETAASARAYVNPGELVGRDDVMRQLVAACARPGVVRLRAVPGVGATRLLEELAVLAPMGRPRLMLVDVAAGADETAKLVELQRRALEGDEPRCAVAVVRPGSPLDERLRDEGAAAVDLPPAGEDVLLSIVAGTFPERGDVRPLARRLLAVCGGAPARAVSLLVALHARGLAVPGVLCDDDAPGPEVLDAPGPAALGRALADALAAGLGAGSDERRLAALVACARRTLTPEAARVAFESGGGGAARFAAAARHLRESGVLAAGAFAPDGDLVREALGLLLSDDDRRAAHRALVRALENRRTPWEDPDPLAQAEEAHHLLAVGDPRAAGLARDSARALLGRDAGEAAALLLVMEAAGKLSPDDRALLARALSQTGELDAALRQAQQAAAGGASGAALLAAEILVRRGDYRGAAADLEPLSGDDAADALLAKALALSGQHDRALAVSEKALARRPASPHDIDLATSGALARFYKGELDAAEKGYAAARDLARRAGDRSREAAAVNGLGLVAQRRARFDDARARYEEVLALAESCGDRVRAGTCHLNLGTVLQELGRSREAAQSYRRAAAVARLVGERAQSARARSNLANLLVYAGRLAEAREAAQAAAELAERASAGVVHSWSILLLGECALLSEARDEAVRLLGDARDRFVRMENASEALEAETFLARARLEHGDAAGACTAALDAAGRARGRSLDLHEARALLVAADAHVLLGQERRALAAAHRALGLALPSGRPDLLWRIEAALARASAPDAESQGFHATRALAGLEAAAAGLDADDREPFLTRPDRARLKALLAPLAAAHRVNAGDARLGRLLAINRRLGAERNLRALLDSIVDQAVELCGAERGFVLLAPAGGDASGEGGREAKEQPLNVLVARNIDGESLAKGALRVSRSIAERVMKEGEPELTLDAQEDERYQRQESIAALKLRSVLCVPLRFQGRVLGALYLDNRFRARAFGRDDLGLLESFADQASIALAQVRSLEEAREARERADAARAQIEELNRRLAERVEAQEAEIARARREAEEQRLAAGSTRFGDLVGESPAMRRVLRLMERVAPTDLTVLVTGESGTGKELVARALFAHGPRPDRPFVSINCGALAEGLLESELFGHVRGAFTGADRDKEGLFQVADGGTLFLDEVGDMGLSMQVKLLRALQEGEIRKVGGRNPARVDVRVIAATNRDLEKLMQEGRFREDLYYRLNVVSLRLPPLRERREDLPLLCARLLAELPARDGRTCRLSPAALTLLGSYAWPGNIRELRATLHTAALFAEGEVLTPADFANKAELFRVERVAPAADSPLAGRPIEQLEAEAIRRTLEMTRGNKAETARLLGIDRKTLYNKLARLRQP